MRVSGRTSETELFPLNDVRFTLGFLAACLAARALTIGLGILVGYYRLEGFRYIVSNCAISCILLAIVFFPCRWRNPSRGVFVVRVGLSSFALILCLSLLGTQSGFLRPLLDASLYSVVPATSLLGGYLATRLLEQE